MSAHLLSSLHGPSRPTKVPSALGHAPNALLTTRSLQSAILETVAGPFRGMWPWGPAPSPLIATVCWDPPLLSIPLDFS